TINKATAMFSGLTTSQTIDCGTPTISRSGRLNNGGSGSTLTAPAGETITIAVDGTTVASPTLSGNQGNFGPITIDTHLLTGGNHTITYTCVGDSNFTSATTGTTVTVNNCMRPRPSLLRLPRVPTAGR